MGEKPFQIIPLDLSHDRSEFDSGSQALNSYFRERVTQDMRRRVTACFVAMSGEGRIGGYYTLASTSVFLGELPPKLARKLPRYPSVPAVRMGRLAVDRRFRGRGLGGALLADGLIRVNRSEIAAYALVVDAKDEGAANLYRHHGFLETKDKPLTLFLPLATVAGLR